MLTGRVRGVRSPIERDSRGKTDGFMPFDTSDGLKEVKWQEHYAFFISLFKSSPIFESRNLELRDCFLNEQTGKNKDFLKKFQERLGNVPRLVVSGSDAHCFVGVKGDNDKRGYGDFPSGKITWIKADPTFLGLQQAILEPAKRSFIGDRPPKQVEIEANKPFYIDRVEITKHVASAPDHPLKLGIALLLVDEGHDMNRAMFTVMPGRQLRNGPDLRRLDEGARCCARERDRRQGSGKLIAVSAGDRGHLRGHAATTSGARFLRRQLVSLAGARLRDQMPAAIEFVQGVAVHSLRWAVD